MPGCLTSKQINVVPMNMKVIIFLGLLAAVHCLKDDKWQRKTINQTDDEVDVEISDESGNAWSENIIFEHKGYEVVKPKKRNVCLIRKAKAERSAKAIIQHAVAGNVLFHLYAPRPIAVAETSGDVARRIAAQNGSPK
ncbi:hypothetical protein MAR_037126 [Mya arenaria]|uniref:Uncharacterized protein n=1 Tax=Mya arenaria TaxID=6604 RepID=A0ABY7FQY8_MYAAR|nr:hypothetical protein MAR_037126 [Mya arenaria]